MEHPRPWTAISSDIVRSSDGGYPRQSDLAVATESVIAEAQRDCPYPGPWIRRERGDGELTLAPADVPLAWLLTDYLRRLEAGVLAWNRNKNDAHQLRLRVGVDFGLVKIDSDGVPRGGDAIVNAARLRDCDVAREATVAVPHAPVVAVVSDAVYRQVVPYGERGTRPEMFRRVRAAVPEKDYETTAWLHVPGHHPPYLSDPMDEPESEFGTRSAPAATKREARSDRSPGGRDERPAPPERSEVTNIGSQVNGDHNQFQIRDINLGGGSA